MRESSRNAVVVAVLASMLGCTEMPVIKLNDNHSQRKLSSASQWQLIADDLVKYIDGVRAMRVDNDGHLRCVRIARQRANPTATPPPTRFESFLTDLIAEEFVSPEGFQVFERRAGDVNEPTPMSVSNEFAVYRDDSTDKSCDEVTVAAEVINHAGPPGRPYPGQYTLLAAGLVVVRNVVRAFSEASALGAVAAGEGAFWASSGFRSSDTVTELAVTISRVTEQKMYVAQFTNVYYINSGDTGLYEQAAAVVTPKTDPPWHPSEAQKEQRRVAAERDRLLKPRILSVVPRTVSACDSSARFFVTGAYLSSNPHDYLFGSIPANSLGVVRPEYSYDETPQTVQVFFIGLKNVNKGLDEVTLSTDDLNGKPASAHIYIDGAPACAKATPPGGAPKAPAPKNSSIDVKFAQKGKLIGDPVNLCASPVELTATEVGKAELSKVQTEDGSYEAAICKNPGQSTKSVTFANFPKYSDNSLPANHLLTLKATLTTGKILEKQILVTCDSRNMVSNNAQAVPKKGASCQ